jgi:hypothetical protein
MRQKRRQELRTNELAQTLAEIRDFFSRHGTHALIGAFLVLVVGGSIWYTIHSRRLAHQNAWTQLYSLNAAEPDQQLTAYRSIAENAADPVLAGTGWLMLGHAAWNQARTTDVLDSPDRLEDLLQTAEQAFQRAIQVVGNEPALVASARIGLAIIAEERYDTDEVRLQYQAVLDIPGAAHTGFYEMAEAGLASAETLTERITFPAPLPKPDVDLVGPLVPAATPGGPTITTAPSAPTPEPGPPQPEPAATQEAAPIGPMP